MITLITFAGAILIRGLMLGFGNAASLSETHFPAFIVATLYAGPRWGWGSLVAMLLVGYFGTTTLASTVSRDMVILQFGLSGAATVLVAGALREALLQLTRPRRPN